MFNQCLSGGQHPTPCAVRCALPVTFTYLIPFDDCEQATNANAAMENISENHINAKQPTPNVEAPARAISSRGNTTVQMRFGRKYGITSYVKNGRTQFSYNRIPSHVETFIFAESSRHYESRYSSRKHGSKPTRRKSLILPLGAICGLPNIFTKKAF